MLQAKKRNKTGFTLIEVIIVIAIIGIMTAISIVSLRGGKTSNNLETSRREVASIIKLAQSYALQGKITGGNTPCGFGVRFTDSNSYELFYIVPGSGSCSDKNSSSASRRCSGNSDCHSLENYDLKSDIAVNDYSDKDIYFIVPHASVYNSSGASFGGNSLTFKSGDLKTKELSINSLGLITE